MLLNTRPNVLCVDDDEDACEMLSALLSSYGIDATCAKSATAAWLKIRAERFDLYMLDSWMPGLDGFEFCRQIRKAGSSTPILFYSGAAYEADKQKGIAAGANAYVTKPDVDGLIKSILALTTEARTQDINAGAIVNNQVRPESLFSPQFFNAKTASD